MSQFIVYAPLQRFVWSGTHFSFTPKVEIRRFLSRPDLRGLEKHLAANELQDLTPRHWVTFHWTSGDQPNPAEIVNLFLLALWVAKPTRTQVTVRFEIATDPNEAPGTRYRLLDRFNWVQGTAVDRVEDADLVSAASYFSRCRELRMADHRLLNGLLLTLAGCTAHHWQVAFICHTAAAEALLTVDTPKESPAALPPVTRAWSKANPRS